MSESKELIKDTPWIRVYRVGKALMYESKCLSEGLQISAAEIKSRWTALAREKKLEFTIAFGAIPKLSAEDEEILSFLMKVEPDDGVLSNLALQYSMHSDRERVLPFLLGRINPLQRHCANYFQALELMRDPRAIPPLRRAYDYYRRLLGEGQLNSDQLFDYVQCCETLLVLDGSPEFESALREILFHPDENARRLAAQLLASKPT